MKVTLLLLAQIYGCCKEHRETFGQRSTLGGICTRILFMICVVIISDVIIICLNFLLQ